MQLRAGHTSDYGCQYRAIDSPVHRLGAGPKLAAAAALSTAAVLASEPWSIATVAALDALCWACARLSLADLWRDTRWLLFQAVIILGLYLTRWGIPALGPGLRVASQIGLFFVPGAIFLRTTQGSQMMRGLRRVLPYHISFLVFTSLRFVPLFARELRQITFAQGLRGARLTSRDLLRPTAWRDAFHCVTIPLLVRALKTSEEAALSAEARGFGSRPTRTYFDVARARPGAAGPTPAAGEAAPASASRAITPPGA